MTMSEMSANLEAAAERVNELGDQVAAQARRNGLQWLESCEKGQNMPEPRRAGRPDLGVDWASTLATTYANFVRETSEIFLSAISRGSRG